MTTATAPKHDAGTLARLHPDQLADSPFNYRRTYSKAEISAMAETAKRLGDDGQPRGIYTPLLARPVGKKFELIFGHKRKRAAKEAGLESVPVIVRAMSDSEVRIAQAVENLQRSDVPPLEEADGFKALMEKEGLEIEEIAAQVGRPKSYVYLRLKLCNLHADGRKLLKAGKLLVGAAELIARIESKTIQKKVIKEAKPSQWSPDAKSVKDVRELCERLAMLKLAKAPFDVKDAGLTDAPSCGDCPKRTGGNPDLFGGHDDKDLCTDAKCYDEKARVSWKQRVKDAKATGAEVLSKADTKKVFPFGNATLPGNSKWTSLDKDEWDSSTAKWKTWRKILGAEAVKLLPKVLARDPQGGVHELVKNEDLRKVLKEKGLNKPGRAGQRGGGAGANTISDKERRAKAKARQEQEAKRRTDQWAHAEISTQAAKLIGGRALWKLIASVAVTGGWSDSRTFLCKRRGLEVPKGGSAQDVLLELIEKGHPKTEERPARMLTEAELRGLALEALARPGQQFQTTEFKRLVEFFKIDLKSKAAEFKKEVAEEAKVKKKAKTKKKTKQTKAKKEKRKKAGHGVRHVRDRGGAPAGKVAVLCKAKGKDLVYSTLQTAKKNKKRITCPNCYKSAFGEDMPEASK